MKHNLRKRISLWRERLFEQTKLALACRLHGAFPARYCWADCVAYSVAYYRLNPFKIDRQKAKNRQQSDSGATSPPDGGKPPGKIYTSQRGCIILMGLVLLFWVLLLGTCYKSCYVN